MAKDLQDQEIKVLFDQLCSVCRVLAGLVEGEALKGWRFVPWQAYQVPPEAPPSWHEKHPSELRIVAPGLFLEGEKAWQYLLEHNPRLRSYQNLAAKIGLSPPRGARWLQIVGHSVRKLCYSCVYYRRS